MEPSPRRTRAQRKQQQQQQQLLPSTTVAESPNPDDQLVPIPEVPNGSTPFPKGLANPRIYYQAPMNLAKSSHPQPMTIIPARPSKSSTKLSSADHKLLLHKQSLIAAIYPQNLAIPKSFQKHQSSLALIESTLIFAREEAGTAVMIRDDGLILTCAHCIAETREEFEVEKAKEKFFWLILGSGRIVSAKCIAWDPTRDLALLSVVSSSACESVAASGTNNSLEEEGTSGRRNFQPISLAETSPPKDTPLLCIGHPGSEDLETARRGVKTNYDVLHISTGFFRGVAEGQDIQDNEEIGALMHDCWTYWGHSGAPLLDRKTGKLVGLHSSWDDETGMRRGVAIEAINEFIRLCGVEL